MKTLRLILGDQLNSNHSWFTAVDDAVTYVFMETRSETDYVQHHIQKVVGFFASMRAFAEELRAKGHRVLYVKITDVENKQTFEHNLRDLIEKEKFGRFEYQLPDEYRLDTVLKSFCSQLSIDHRVFDSEHFYTEREELEVFFSGKSTLLMESFYRNMRKKHQVLMYGEKPLFGQWNFDKDNRKKLPKNHQPIAPLVFHNNVNVILDDLKKTDVRTIGHIDGDQFFWPINRKQSLELLEFFATECLPFFGTYQDAMTPTMWSMYHSRLSFSLNLKMLSPQEVVDRAVQEWQERPDVIAFNQLEGFVRQILGWREYMRGIYWSKMPEYAHLNYFNHQEKLPEWYWTGKTKMNCMRDAITQSLHYAYAHHIQRLMITGNFALLAGVHPDAVDRWYLGIYIDAIEWVEITNTRGMSQFADGGIVGTKPYVSSATYIDTMSHYCGSCYYKKNVKVGDRACPFNSLYWNFFDNNEQLLSTNPRVSMMYNVWRKMSPLQKEALIQQAQQYLKNIDTL